MGTYYIGTSTDVRALDTCISLIRAAESVSIRIHRHLEAVDLTVSQFEVLEALLHVGPMSQRDLGQKLLKSGGNITLVVDNLEKRQLVRRDRQIHDRRIVLVCLTRQGEQLIRDLFPKHVATVAKEMSILTDAEQEELGCFCQRLSKHEAAEQS